MPIQRTILKQELANKLYPNSASDGAAMKQLQRELRPSAELRQQIAGAGPTKSTYYTRQQALLILGHLNISEEEYARL